MQALLQDAEDGAWWNGRKIQKVNKIKKEAIVVRSVAFDRMRIVVHVDVVVRVIRKNRRKWNYKR